MSASLRSRRVGSPVRSRRCSVTRTRTGPPSSNLLTEWMPRCRPANCPAGPLGQDLYVPVRSMHADPLPIPDQPGGMLYLHDGRWMGRLVLSEGERPLSLEPGAATIRRLNVYRGPRLSNCGLVV